MFDFNSTLLFIFVAFIGPSISKFLTRNDLMSTIDRLIEVQSWIDAYDSKEEDSDEVAVGSKAGLEKFEKWVKDMKQMEEHMEKEDVAERKERKEREESAEMNWILDRDERNWRAAIGERQERGDRVERSERAGRLERHERDFMEERGMMDEKQERMMKADAGRRMEHLERMERTMRGDKGMLNAFELAAERRKRQKENEAALVLESKGRQKELALGKKMEHVYSLDGKRMERQVYDYDKHHFVRLWEPRIHRDRYHRRYDFSQSGQKHHTGERRYDARVARLNQKHHSHAHLPSEKPPRVKRNAYDSSNGVSGKS